MSVFKSLLAVMLLASGIADAQVITKIVDLPNATIPFSGAEAGVVSQSDRTVQFPIGTLAPVASPQLTGTPTAPTPTTGNNSTAVATTAYVQGQNYLTPSNLTPCGDTDCTIVGSAGANIVSIYTAPRKITLPAAANVTSGLQVCIVDMVGGVTLANYLTVAAAGSDIIDRTIGSSPTSLIFKSAPAVCFVSNGSTTWTSRSGVAAQAILCNPDGAVEAPQDCSAAQAKSVLGLSSAFNCGTSVPTITLGSGAGTGATVSLNGTSSSCAGRVSVTTGTSPSAGAIIFTMARSAGSFTQTPFCVFSPGNTAVSSLSGNASVFISPNASGFDIDSGSTPLAGGSTTYVFMYVCSPGSA